MKNVNEFIKGLVKVDSIESVDCFGHYPFQLFAENNNGTAELNALALGGDIKACRRRFNDYKKSGAKKIYMSLDFPAGGDIDKDFIVVVSLEGEEISLLAIPYSTEDGKLFPTIKESDILSKIKSEFLASL